MVDPIRDTTNDGPADGQAEALPPPPFSRVPERRPGRRRDPLTREAIVAAAIKVLDTEGLDRFSMRRVAGELGAGAASLYWHVGSKDGLLDLVMDEVIGEIEVPDADPERWREQLKEVARAMRAADLRHRDAVRVSIGRIPLGPNALRFSERVLAILRAGGIPDELAVRSYLLLISTVNGYTIDDTGSGGDPPAEQPPDDEAGTLVSDYMASLPPGRFPNLAAVSDRFAISDRDREFELLLDLFVDGLERRVAAERGG